MTLSAPRSFAWTLLHFLLVICRRASEWWEVANPFLLFYLIKTGTLFSVRLLNPFSYRTALPSSSHLNNFINNFLIAVFDSFTANREMNNNIATVSFLNIRHLKKPKNKQAKYFEIIVRAKTKKMRWETNYLIGSKFMRNFQNGSSII